MTDRREAILVRILAIMQARADAPNNEYVTVARNVGLRDNDKRPAAVLTDGSERRESGERSGVFRTQLMRMEPKIYILPKEARPSGTSNNAENVGTETNRLRKEMCKALAMDATLKALVGSNGSITLEDITTDLESGSAMSGEMQIGLSIVYPFNPTTD